MRPSPSPWLPRAIVVAYMLAAVLGVNLVLCVQAGGHAAFEFLGAADCEAPVGPADCPCAAADQSCDSAGGCCGDEHDGEDCADFGLLASHGAADAPVHGVLVAAALGARASGAPSTGLGRERLARPTRPPRTRRDARRGTVLRC